MKFASTLVLVAAAATAVLAVPHPQSQSGQGDPHAPAQTANPHDPKAPQDPHGQAPPKPEDTHGQAPKPEDSHGQAPKPEDTHGQAPKPEGGEHNAQPDVKIPYSDTNAVFQLLPADAESWAAVKAPGVFNDTARFSTKNQEKATATFEPPHQYAGLQIWAYQRSDGGLMRLDIDGAAVARVDLYNATAGETDPPVLVYENAHLERKHHVVKLTNMMDPRVHKYGQFNVDHVVITAAADAPITDTVSAPVPTGTATGSSTATVPPPPPPTAPTTPPPSVPGTGTDGTGQQQAPGSALSNSPRSVATLVAGVLAAVLALL